MSFSTVIKDKLLHAICYWLLVFLLLNSISVEKAYCQESQKSKRPKKYSQLIELESINILSDDDIIRINKWVEKKPEVEQFIYKYLNESYEIIVNGNSSGYDFNKFCVLNYEQFRQKEEEVFLNLSKDGSVILKLLPWDQLGYKRPKFLDDYITDYH
jgi:hypothetical protein